MLGPSSRRCFPGSLAGRVRFPFNFYHKETSCTNFHSGQELIVEDRVLETRLLRREGAGAAEDA